MTTIRRVFLYLASFIGMSVTLAGVFILIGLIVDQGFDAFRGFSVVGSASALALIIAGGLTWRFYWRTVQREAGALREERTAGTRKLYLYGTMTLNLLSALLLVQQVLSELLIRVFDLGLSGYKPWAPLLVAAVLASVWRWHERVAAADQAAEADGPRGGDLRRGYWFVLTAFGIFGVTGGLTTFITGLLTHLGGEAPASFFGSGASWMQTLFPPLAQMLVAGFAVWMFWLPSQKLAAAGDETERASRARWVLVHLVVFSAALAALNGAQQVLTDILSRLLQGSGGDLLVVTIGAPLASLIVGGLLLWYFFSAVRPTLTTARLAEYLIAGIALFIAVFSVQLLIAMLFQVLGGAGPRIENLIVNILPGLLVGGGVWRWRWRGLEAEASGSDSASARSYLWRKVYLYFFQLVGLILILAGAVTILQGVIAALLGQPISGNALSALSLPLSFLLVGSGLLIYMMQLVASDGRLGALSVEQVMQHTLGDSAPTWAIAAVIAFVLGPLLSLALLGLLGPAIGNIFNEIIRGIQ
ncbi:MAG TPA: DUF5671 domain-containing protein [Anaerolineae bacterium]|nr:DUF5671 domain-containing protein [Anaerolineae bacterium]